MLVLSTEKFRGGTASRISFDDNTGLVDIDSVYVGQASITTLGTITTGLWNVTATSGNILAATVSSTGIGLNITHNGTTTGNGVSITTANTNSGSNPGLVITATANAGVPARLANGTSLTNTAAISLVLAHNGGIPAANFGTGIRTWLESSTTTNQIASDINTIWTDATHATLTSAIVFYLRDNGAALAEFLRVTSSGITVTGDVTANNISSGVYTPTLTEVNNIDVGQLTTYEAQYIKIGSVVTVSGKLLADPTLAATSTQVGISLPVASNIGSQEDCCGTAFSSDVASQGAAIRGDATNNRAEMVWISGDITNQPMYYTFTYSVI